MRILLTDNIDPVAAERLRAEGFEVDERPTLDRDTLKKEIRQYDAVAVRSATILDEEILQTSGALKLIVRGGVGIDNIDLAAATRSGIAVANTPDANTTATAELTMALMLALVRLVVPAHQSLTSGEWKRSRFRGVELCGKTLGVIGFGRIGRAVARRARAFEMRILAYDPYIDKDSFAQEQVTPVGIEELYRQADIITLHIPLTDETRRLIDASAIDLMKTGVRLINTARGGLLDDEAVALALNQGKIAGVALDVYQTEPPPPDHPLIGHPKVLSVPHLGAYTQEAQNRVAEEVARVIVDFFKHNLKNNVINSV